MPTVYIGVGSNLGERQNTIQEARETLKREASIHSLQSSTVFETAPVGGPPQGKFLNAVWEVETNLSAVEIHKILIRIEKKFGRVRSVANGPRTLDLDLLAYGDSVLESADLTVPHPRLHERLFVLEPLVELNANWTHPVSKKNVRDLIKECHENTLYT